MAITNTVFPFNKDAVLKIIGKSEQAKNIFEQMSIEGAKTVVFEKDYIEKNYLIDYQKFYSRCFNSPSKFTNRIHFFYNEFSNEDFEKMLDKNKPKKLNPYLGFVVVKPIPDDFGNNLIGRTLVSIKSKKKSNNLSHYITRENSVSLFGFKLGIETLPFQAQDQGVSACATIALWTAMEALHKFGIPELSPAEITEQATQLPSLSRRYPQAGLTLAQMISCIRFLGLDSETIVAKKDDPNDDILTTAIKVHTLAGIPLIAELELTDSEDKTASHAVVISGYEANEEGKILKLLIHDDQLGPYSLTQPVNDFRVWKNNWIDHLGCKKIELQLLIAPVYHKIRLPFSDMYVEYIMTREKKETEEPLLKVDLYLTTVQEYKKDLIKRKVKNKSEVLKKSMPRFLWIERFTKKDKKETRLYDYVFDGTQPFRKDDVTMIEYNL
jgi:hypothetical protein